MQTVPETREDGVQADLDNTRTQGLSLDSSADSADLNFPSHFGEDLESELLPIRVFNQESMFNIFISKYLQETKASIARKKKISEMNPKDPVHCHYPKNKEHDHHDHDHND